MKKLSPFAIKHLRAYPSLAGDIAESLGVSSTYFRVLLINNDDERLIQKEVVQSIQDHVRSLQSMPIVVKSLSPKTGISA